MPQDNFVKMSCSVCEQITYHGVHKNKKTVQKKLELNKFCKHCRKHTPHKELKK